jgi:AraC-like DNA-binding protein
MSKQKLILYSHGLQDCPCRDRIFSSEYETIIANTEEEFFSDIHNVPADAAVICFCSAREEDVENVLRLDALTGPLPVLTCSKTLNPEFIRKAAQEGAARFVVCGSKPERIRDIIDDAIREEGLREYLQSRWPDSLTSSPHIHKLIEEIIYTFPHRMKVNEMAVTLGIGRGWLHKACKQAFGIPLTTLVRQVRVHQALRMMKHTNLDNAEIAWHLYYTEESSMAREFHKELGYCPNEARRRLTEQSPEEVLR